MQPVGETTAANEALLARLMSVHERVGKDGIGGEALEEPRLMVRRIWTQKIEASWSAVVGRGLTLGVSEERGGWRVVDGLVGAR